MVPKGEGGAKNTRTVVPRIQGRPIHPGARCRARGDMRRPEARAKIITVTPGAPESAASNADRKGRPQQHALDARCPVDRTQSRDKNKQAAMTTDLTRHRVVAHERVVATSTEALRETVVVCVESSRQRVTLSRELLRVLRELPRRRGDTIPSMAWSA